MKYYLLSLLLMALACGGAPDKPASNNTAEIPPPPAATGPQAQTGTLNPILVEHEIPPGNPPARYFKLDRLLFFVGTNNRSARGLWRSDGTREGTTMLKALEGGGSGNPGYLSELNGLVYFLAETGSGLTRTQIWYSNGTQTGTQSVSPPGLHLAKNLIAFKGRLYFSGNELLSPQKLAPMRLYQSRGTPGQATLLKEIPAATHGAEQFFIHNDFLFFTTVDHKQQTTVWRTDGSAAGTIPLHTFPTRFSAYSYNYPAFFSWQGKTWFVAGDAATGAELWQTDGTPAGTRPWVDLLPGPGSAFSSSAGYFPYQNGLFWWRRDPQDPELELWFTRGTAASTVKIKTFPDVLLKAGHSDLMALMGNKLHFLINSNTGQSGLWETDGTAAGTRQVKFLSLLSNELLRVGDALYFSARQETFPELGCLWRFDARGIRPDLEPGPQYRVQQTAANPRYLFLDDRAIWYVADNGLNRYEPFVPPLQLVFANRLSPEFNLVTGGEIKAEVRGGAPPYQLQWDNGATGMSASGLHDGVHSAVLADSRGFEKTIRFLYLKGDSVQPFRGGLRIAREELPRFSAGALVQTFPARKVNHAGYEEPVYALSHPQIVCYGLEKRGHTGASAHLLPGLIGDSTRFDWFRMGYPHFYDHSVTARPEADGYLITPMPNGGFESVGHVFAAWKAAGPDSLDFLGLFPERKDVGIGSIIIRQLVRLEEGVYLVLGSQSGGDAGDAAGSEWVGVWRLPLDFQIKHQESWKIDASDTQIDVVETAWDSAAQTVVFRRYRAQPGKEAASNRKLLKTTRVSRKELLK